MYDNILPYALALRYHTPYGKEGWNKVYIPVLWPNVINEVNEESYEYQLANSILPLPVDQRYRIEDMEYMAELICKVVWNRGGVL